MGGVPLQEPHIRYQMSFLPEASTFEAVRRASFAVTLHNADGFAGMRKAGRLAAEVLDLMVPLVRS